MYIKQVIIQGFRSYRDQTVIDPFSPRHNVVVGRNGSGKSNFFLAIQFVLSDEFSHMRQEERQQLLHEGTGPRVVSAFVEIIFDNSDNRMPIDREEVSLRRVIGSKKDQYFLDKKNVTKTDVMNLLESAGFSRSNPYYIVKQGRINQLAVAKDSERIKLLREVAGTRVYDERKEESKQILVDTEGKREKIDEMLNYIEERLTALESEKEELKEYQKWDKEKRCLEYTIHDKELRETREKLEKLESTRMMGSERSNEIQQEVEEASDKVQSLNQKLKGVQDELKVVSLERQQLEEERTNQIQTRTKMELDLNDLVENVKEDAVIKANAEREMNQLELTISEKDNELQSIIPNYEHYRQVEEEQQSRLKSCEQRRNDLYAKQVRKNQFTSKEARDQWIKKEMKSLSSTSAARQQQLTGLQQDVAASKTRVEEIEKEIQERSDDLEQRKTLIENAQQELSEVKVKKDELYNVRSGLWKQDNSLSVTLQNATEDLARAERNLKGTMSRAMADGIQSVKKIVQERGIQGVYGPLIENFTCGEKFFTAVEVTAGNKLFNIIVDNDKTSTQILSIMNQQHLPGVATFMPLNRLRFKDLNYPDSSDVIPMINKVDYDSKFKPAMQYTFGKTLICRSMEIASQFAKSADMDCITLEGDQVSRRGALTGGYYDTRKSRLESQKLIWSMQAKVEEHQKMKTDLVKQLSEIDGQITSANDQYEKCETKRIHLKDTYSLQKGDVRNKMSEKHNLSVNIAPKEESIRKMEREIVSLKNRFETLQEELGSELLVELSPQDQQEIEQLNKEIFGLHEKLKESFTQRSKLENEKQLLENLLQNNLCKRLESLMQGVEEVSLEDRSQQLQMKRSELQAYSQTIAMSDDRFEEVGGIISNLNGRISAMQESLDDWRAIEKEKCGLLTEDTKLMEKIASKRSLAVKKKEECMKKIRELGSLPADAFEKYQKTSLKVLWRKLHDCTEELKKYSHVNKKALDQFVSFSEQKEKLIKRKTELDHGHEAIVDLMEVLEQRKHEAILFTFKQVSHNFSQIFKELVPGGRATLIMKKETPEAMDDNESAGMSQANSETMSQTSQRSSRPIDDFSGISIKVSFTGNRSETYEMNQLSGGQKTVVALTLIFAIQKCDPAPFYLFDEIDQALDPQYRKAVAGMIHKLSENAQFITTTFRPELLESSDQFYGVQFKNKVSHIITISKEQAKDFVEDDTVEK